MTVLAVELSRVSVPGDELLTPYSWRGVCRVDGCSRPATDPHHIVARGVLGRAARWILLDGELVANVAGVCRWHHDKLTTGLSRIYWQGEWRYESEARNVPMRPLGQVDAVRHRGGKGCPHCGRPMPKPNPYPLAPRRVRRVGVIVPDDAESGAVVLESLAEQVAEAIGLENPRGRLAPYHAMTTALTAFLLDDDLKAGLRRHLQTRSEA